MKSGEGDGMFFNLLHCYTVLIVVVIVVFILTLYL